MNCVAVADLMTKTTHQIKKMLKNQWRLSFNFRNLSLAKFNSSAPPIFGGFILLGHGIKLYGVALLDELVLLTSIVIRPKITTSQIDALAMIVGVYIFFSSTFSIISEQQHIVFIARNLLLGLGICYLSTLPKNWFDFPVRPLFALTYIGVNLVFVLVERGAFLLSGSVILCETQSSDCLLPVAAWQAIWTGTAYSSLGLFVSLLFIFQSKHSQRLGAVALGLCFFISAYQLSRLGMIFCFIAAAIFIQQRQNTTLGFSAAIALFVILADLVFTFVTNHPFDSAAISEFIAQYWYQGKIPVVFVSAYFVLFDFNSTLQSSPRSHQILSMLDWYRLTQEKELIFGNLTGSHRNGINASIPVDQSGVLRPVGIVAWLYDWGVFFLAIYFATITRELLKIVRAIARKQINCLLGMTSGLAYLAIAMTPLVTAVTDSVLFWILVFNSKNFLVWPIRKNSKT